jgi:dTDP-L-rhamnose 4-epimerase
MVPQMALMIGRAYGIDAIALRLFNVYGPRQALSNPYTGVLAIFASRLLNGKPPLIFEDGLQKRDFVSVYDIAKALRLALESPSGANEIINIGGGPENAVGLLEVIDDLSELSGVEPQVRYGPPRKGDQPYYISDTRRFNEATGWMPQVPVEEGISQLYNWIAENVHSGLGVLQPRE